MAYVHIPNLKGSSFIKFNLNTEGIKSSQDLNDFDLEKKLIENIQKKNNVLGDFEREGFQFMGFMRSGQFTDKYILNSKISNKMETRLILRNKTGGAFGLDGVVYRNGEKYTKSNVGPNTTLFDMLRCAMTPIGSKIDYDEIDRKVNVMIASGEFTFKNPYQELKKEKEIINNYLLRNINFSIKSNGDVQANIKLDSMSSIGLLSTDFSEDSAFYKEAICIHNYLVKDLPIEKIIYLFNISGDLIKNNLLISDVKEISNLRVNCPRAWSGNSLEKYVGNFTNLYDSVCEKYKKILEKEF